MSSSKNDNGSSGGAEKFHLQQRCQDMLHWHEAGQNDLLAIKVHTSQQTPHLLCKETICTESPYFRSCYTSTIDPYPKVTARLINLTLEDSQAYRFIIPWFRICPRIPIGLAAPSQQPTMTIKEWYHSHQIISFEGWCYIYCLAETLMISRMCDHVLVAVGMKAIHQKILPSPDAVTYLYGNGSRFCALKNVFVDMFAISALKPRDVFGAEREAYPREFVEGVGSWRKDAKYVERRKGLKEAKRERTEEEGEDKSDGGNGDNHDGSDEE